MVNLVDRIKEGILKVGLVAVLGASTVFPTGCASEPEVVATYGKLSTGTNVEVIGRGSWNSPNTNRISANGDYYYVKVEEDGVVRINNYEELSRDGIVYITLADYNKNGEINFSEGEWASFEKWSSEERWIDTYQSDGKSIKTQELQVVGYGYRGARIYGWVQTGDEFYSIDDYIVADEMEQVATDAKIYLRAVAENEWMWPD